MPFIDICGEKLKEGDSCFVRADGDVLNAKPFIAKLIRIEPDEEHGGYTCRVLWYYRPEDPGIPGGRKAFHGERELYRSDHRDSIHSNTILGPCFVHALDDYRNLEVIRPQDYYTRFQWSVQHKRFSPDSVTVYCRCRQPENPDQPMFQCDICKEWFHAECVGSEPSFLEALNTWRCPDCEQRAVFGNGFLGPPAAAAAAGVAAAASGGVATPSVTEAAGGPTAAAAGAAAAAAVAPPLPPDPILEALQAQLLGLHNNQQHQQHQQHQQQSIYSGGGGGWSPGTVSNSGSGLFGL